MTEQEWLASDDPQAMLEWWYTHTKNWPCDLMDVEAAYQACDRKLRLWCEASALAVGLQPEAIQQTSERNKGNGILWVRHWAADTPPGWSLFITPSRPVKVALLREIVGNPFRPLVIPPAALAWNDRAVPRLAQAIYDENDWSQERLGILADVCEEAGITDEAVLGHLRDQEWCPICEGRAGEVRHLSGGRWAGTEWNPCQACRGYGKLRTGPHVRGCHVVDVLIGKE